MTKHKSTKQMTVAAPNEQDEEKEQEHSRGEKNERRITSLTSARDGWAVQTEPIPETNLSTAGVTQLFWERTADAFYLFISAERVTASKERDRRMGRRVLGFNRNMHHAASAVWSVSALRPDLSAAVTTHTHICLSLWTGKVFNFISTFTDKWNSPSIMNSMLDDLLDRPWHG